MASWEAVGKSDDWYTPKYIFDALGCEFDLDVAAPIEGPRYVPAKKWLYEMSLATPWHGFVWMNPPFGGRGDKFPWIHKFFDHGNGIALLPDRTSADWFQYAARHADAMIMMYPRVKFERPDGTIGGSPGCGTVLFASGAEGVVAVHRARSLGIVVRPAELVA